MLTKLTLVATLVTNDGGGFFIAMVFIFCQYVLHSSQSMVICVALS